MFLIEWKNSRKQKWVRRFNILFAGEKIVDFSRRMEYASNARNEFETKLHKDEMITKEVATSDTIPFPQEFKVGILRKLGLEITKKQMPHLVTHLLILTHFRMNYLEKLMMITFFPSKKLN
jgi:hypothetical protein